MHRPERTKPGSTSSQVSLDPRRRPVEGTQRTRSAQSSRTAGTIEVPPRSQRRIEREQNISPGSKLPSAPIPSPPSSTAIMGDHRRELSVLQSYPLRNPSSSSVPNGSSKRNPSSGGLDPEVASMLRSNIFDVTNDEQFQLSPQYVHRPSTGGASQGPAGESYFDDRRPSAASVATTASSTGSKSSGRPFYQRWVVFGGGDGNGGESPGSSESSLPTQSTSSKSHFGRPTTPTNNRPRTPLPPSDVVPFVFQDPEDIRQYGYAPVRSTPVVDKEYYMGRDEQPSHSSHSLFHRNKDRGDKGYSGRDKELPAKPPPTPKDSSISLASNTPSSVNTATQNSYPFGRSTSPAPSYSSSLSIPRSPINFPPPSSSTTKDKKIKVRGFWKRKDDKEKDKTGWTANFGLKSGRGTPSELHLASTNASVSDRGGVHKPHSGSAGSIDYFHGAQPYQNGDQYRALPLPPSTPGRGRLLSRKKDDYPMGKDGADDRNPNIPTLDADFSNMQGIVVIPNTAKETRDVIPPYVGPGTAAWAPPPSWQIEGGEEGEAEANTEYNRFLHDQQSNVHYCIRIFRTDATFATLSINLHSSVNDVIHQLGRKSFVSQNLGNYQIVMRKQGLLRLLNPGDRPLLIQKQLLKQAGYTEMDHIEEVGREDHSYLCRFTFQPSRMDKFTLEADPDLSSVKKFSHIDLEGKNLLTIPIALYRKSSDIISLNLSRNLSLNIPLDFIQACINLRKIVFQGNEVYKLPSSLSHASRLTYLDVSNNRLDDLSGAGFDKHPSLVSLKMSNNRLTSLPESFATFKCLRTLNIASNSLLSLPAFLCDLVTLVDLDISFNQIQQLPVEMGKLTKLERFMATNNGLTGTFPATFSNLTQLKELDIRYNELENIDILADLPRLELILAGHNKVSSMEKAFPKIRILHLNSNPLTRFVLPTAVPTLTFLNLASGRMTSFDDTLCDKLPNLSKLLLDKNNIMSFPPGLGKLRRLEHLSCYRNLLTRLPNEISQLTELKYLDLHGNHLRKLPSEIWHLSSLITLNLSSNEFQKFPKFAANPVSSAVSESGHQLSSYRSQSDMSRSEESYGGGSASQRRPSGPGGNLLGVGSSPGSNGRQGSLVSVYGPGGRKASVISKPSSEYDERGSGAATPVGIRKDSNAPSSKIANTLAVSLRHLYLGDNSLDGDVFGDISLLSELRILNLSYNEIYDIPSGSIKKFVNLNELYLSGNELTSLPTDDLESISNLQVLHLNSNKFQTLPAELGKIRKLAVLDVGGNTLKYNISNWPYDWNWNWNLELKYLNLSGNKRLEIKPAANSHTAAAHKNITDFSQLSKLRVLGLMDVTLTIPSVPDETEDRRVRTTGSVVRSTLPYGMADSLGKNEHLSVIDLVIPEFRGRKDECLIGLFDGQSLSNSGCTVSKHLQENFSEYFQRELERLREKETVVNALRRAFLNLNRHLANTAMASPEEKKSSSSGSSIHRGSTASGAVLGEEDLILGSSACVIYIAGSSMYVTNVGDVMALLVKTNDQSTVLTSKDEPGFGEELRRIREAGGFVSRSGKLNDQLTVSRSFGYFNLMPVVQAAPHIHEVHLSDQDEYVIIASKEVWDYIEYEVALDILRDYTNDLMKAASRLRDFAISYGATDKIMVMIVGVGHHNKSKMRVDSMFPKPGEDGFSLPSSRPQKMRPGGNHILGRPGEIAAPEGELAMVFTDIKNSTAMWERFPIAMRAAITAHNQIMRRQLSVARGYEVKTEGDAFMVCFPTPTAALLWCFNVQQALLNAPWPSQILDSAYGKEELGPDGKVIYRGLSVRMGIHWGEAVCEIDPITNRMDYFGPMVNKASRISGEADGGQITVSSDFITEIKRCVDAYTSETLEQVFTDDKLVADIRREMSALSTTGFEVKELGQRKLKGLENMEYVFVLYPPSLAEREKRRDREVLAAEQQAVKDMMYAENEHLDAKQVWELWELSIKLERICAQLNTAVEPAVRPQSADHEAMMALLKANGSKMTDKQLIPFMEHIVTRIENSMANLVIRRMLSPNVGLRGTAAPLTDLLAVLESRLRSGTL